MFMCVVMFMCADMFMCVSMFMSVVKNVLYCVLVAIDVDKRISL